MKNLIQKSLFGFVITILIAGCGAEISDDLDDDADSGSADFSTFVVVGDSLSAGYADGALYLHGQENSYPAILAQQFALAGGGAFAQPLRLPEATGSFVGIPTTDVADRFVLIASGNPERPVTPFTIDPTVPTALLPALTGPFNNFGVPAAKSIHLNFPNLSDPARLGIDANPFFVRFATTPGATMIGDAAARMPTFFILWIGNNDILLNATEGSPGLVLPRGTGTPSFGTGLTDVTPTATFDGAYPPLVAALKTATNKGILANVPDVSSIPYFTTVPFDALVLTQAQADLANGNPSLMAYNMGIESARGFMLLSDAEAASRTIEYSEGPNPVLIVDDDLTDLSGFSLPDLRKASADDFILLPAASKIGVDAGGTYGIGVGLDDGDVLTSLEAAAIELVRKSYNTTIKDAADADPELLYFDAASLLEELNSTGLSYGSGGISSAFIQGGGFSLDGVHPTARGYAVIANEIMKVIEAGFGANLPPVDPNQYTTVFYQ